MIRAEKNPPGLLKEFIGKHKTDPKTPRLTNAELEGMNQAFKFIWKGYKTPGIFKKTDGRLTKPIFYVMAASFTRKSQPGTVLDPKTFKKLWSLSIMMCKIEGDRKQDSQFVVIPPKSDMEKSRKYVKLSEKQTTEKAKRGTFEVV